MDTKAPKAIMSVVGIYISTVIAATTVMIGGFVLFGRHIFKLTEHSFVALLAAICLVFCAGFVVGSIFVRRFGLARVGTVILRLALAVLLLVTFVAFVFMCMLALNS